MSKTKVEIDADLEDLIPQFLDNRKNDIEVLEKLVEQNDLSAISQLAHKIKGAASSYGFSELGEIASQMEIQSKNNQSENLKNLVKKMKVHFNSIEVQFVKV